MIKMETVKKTIVIILVSLLVLSVAGGIVYHVMKTPSTSESVVDIGDGQFCEDSDGGFKPFKKGWIRVTVPEIGYTSDKDYDYCIDHDTVAEYSCDEDYGVMIETYECDAGCDNGVCEECEEHDYKECYNGDVYWFDSCDVREERAESCVNGCSNGQCNAPPTDCNSGEDKCEGSSYFSCSSSGSWINNGIVLGKCNVACIGAEDCQPNHVCQNYQCIYTGGTGDEMIPCYEYNSEEDKCSLIETIPATENCADHSLMSKSDCEDMIGGTEINTWVLVGIGAGVIFLILIIVGVLKIRRRR